MHARNIYSIIGIELRKFLWLSGILAAPRQSSCAHSYLYNQDYRMRNKSNPGQHVRQSGY